MGFELFKYIVSGNFSDTLVRVLYVVGVTANRFPLDARNPVSIGWQPQDKRSLRNGSESISCPDSPPNCLLGDLLGEQLPDSRPPRLPQSMAFEVNMLAVCVCEVVQ